MNKAFTIFGGSGDLTYRKLLPALYKMSLASDIDTTFRIIAIGRRNYSSEEYIEIAKEWVSKFAKEVFNELKFEEFSKRIDYFKMDISRQEEYAALNEYYQTNNIDKHLFYFAVAPKMFLPITSGIKQFECSKNCKVIIEKPFGENLEAATELNEVMEKVFLKENIYHIDHYLGKEMIQSIQTLRFKNAIFKGIWNKDYIENVQISAFESVGVETRGGYYDESGALKDMVQNHLFQVLSIVAMEQPTDMTSDGIHDEQLKVLKSLKKIDSADLADYLVMGQYRGYQEEPNVAFDSSTETFVALKLFVENERWKNVPFYIRTGKKLRKRETEVVIQFKKTDETTEGNVLIIKIQPNEGVYLRFNTKRPGITNEIEKVSMNFCQSCMEDFKLNTPEAYERLLTACINGDRTLFSKWDQIVVSWNFVDDIIRKFNENDKPLVVYDVNTLGPKESDQLLAKANHAWINSEIREV